MRKLYLLFYLMFLLIGSVKAQLTTETFESVSPDASTFTTNGIKFNLSSSFLSFRNFQLIGEGYNGSNRFIQVEDDTAIGGMGQTGTMKSENAIFKMNSLWIYVSGDAGQNAGTSFNGQPGSVSFTGKLAGVTKFVLTRNTTGTYIGSGLPNKGFFSVNFAFDGGIDLTNILIDQLDITLSSNYDYFAIDNFTFTDIITTVPTVTTNTPVTVFGAKTATLGGSNTDGGTTISARGIVWSTTVNPVLNGPGVTNVAATTNESGAFTINATSLPAATTLYYRAYATNAAGTAYGDVKSFTTNPALSATQSQTIACNGVNNGKATVVPSGGKSPYTYSWSPSGGNGATATGLSPNNYTVTITDNEGTFITKTFTIAQNPAIITGVTITDVSCYGGNNGAINISPLGGSGSYTYNWGGGITTQNRSNLTAGTYSVTITDTNSCNSTINNIVVGQPAAALNGIAIITNILCNGQSTGEISLTPSGGTGPYTFLWDDGVTTQNRTGLPAGTYSVTITDAKGCTKLIDNLTITQPPVISATATITSIACNGGNTGAISLTPSGGTGPYTFLWNDGETTQNRTGLIAGVYSVTITDDNGCPLTINNLQVTQPSQALNASTGGGQTNVSCFGGANGTATVAPTGGTPGYSYSWNTVPIQTTATATGLSAGTYTVTVTDANACQTTRSFTITQPTALVATEGSKSNVSCNGGSNGSATVNVTGGTGSYTYSWSPSGGTGATATGLSAGNYTVTVTDANACQTTKSFTITQPTTLTSTKSQTDVLCNGGSTGTATVVASGGAGSYTYSWAPFGGTASTATGLPVGNYSCTVTDANGCSITENFTIREPNAISLTASQINVTCNSGTNGSATVTATGGTGALSYSWVPSGGTAKTATGLKAGTYTVTVTDVNLCSKTQTLTITEPTALAASITSTNASSATALDGNATVTASGGTAPYSYSWSPSGGTGSTANNLKAGIYSVIITDANGCSITETVTIKAPEIIVSGSFTPFTTVYGSVSTSKSITVTGNNLNDPIILTAPSQFEISSDDVNFTNTLNISIIENTPSTVIYLRLKNGLSVNSAIKGDLILKAGTKTTKTVAIPISQVTKANLTVTANPQSKVYGKNDLTLTYNVSGLVNNDKVGDVLTGTLVRVTGEDVGTYAINQGSLVANGNYTLTYIDDKLTINKASLTVTADPQSKVYGTNDPTLTYQITSGKLIGNDKLTGALTRDAGENVGNYTINQGNLVASTNYDFTYQKADFAITKANLTVTADPKSKVYGTNDPTLTYQITSGQLIGNDKLTGALTRDAGEKVGNYAINQGSLSANSNYTLAYTPSDLTITKASLTVTADPQSKVYGTNDPTLTYQITSGKLIGNDKLTGALTRDAGENVGNYTINQGTLVASTNYDFTYQKADFAITKANLTVTADPKSKVYGTNDPTLTYQITSGKLIGNDKLTGALTRDAGEKVGNYAINQGSLSANSNYTLAYTPSDLTITKASLTVTADPQSKVYGTNDPTLTYQITSGKLIGNDKLTGALTRDAGENVGNYTINQGTLLASTNYDLTYQKADFAITKASLTVTADPQSKVYGTNDPTLTYQITSGKLIGNDKLTGALTRDAGEDVGNYTINQGTLVASTNYDFTYQKADFAITKANLTVTADPKSKVYGTNDPTLTYQITSGQLIGNDKLTGALTRDAGENVGNYTINQGTLLASTNYDFTYQKADFEITKANLTVTADPQSKVYGTNDPTLTYQITSGQLIGNDKLTGALTRDAGENVGNYTINQGNLVASTNYDFTYQKADFEITKANLTVTADPQSKVYGTNDPTLTYQITSGKLIGNDKLTGALTRDAGENVGNYTINQGTLLASINYDFTYQKADFEITKATIAGITFSNDSFVYDGSVKSLSIAGTPPTGVSVSYVGNNKTEVGNYTVTATINGGNNYENNTLTALLEITKATQSISWDQTLTVGCDGVTTIQLTAKSSSGLPIVYHSSNESVAKISGNEVVLFSSGYTEITASIASNPNFIDAATVSKVLNHKLTGMVKQKWDDVLIFDNSSDEFVNWQWYKDGQAIVGAQGQYYTSPTPLNGSYMVVVKDKNGNTMETCPLVIVAGQHKGGIKVIPNPARQGTTFTIKADYPLEELKGAKIMITDITGKLYKEINQVSPEVVTQVPMVPGVYIIYLFLENGKRESVKLLVN